jgi:hypothetical protein
LFFDSDFLNAYHVLGECIIRSDQFFCSSTYVFWCESLDVGMAMRICGLNLDFGSVDSQQDFLDGAHLP